MSGRDLPLRIHAFQSMGTVDGPGVRAVVFLQGCPLRCACCHNPDTWDPRGGEETDLDTLMHRIRRCRPYFGPRGGVTVSGGEPLMQAEALLPLFRRLREEGIHTALDTSGYRLDGAVRALLAETDLVLLDYKYTNDQDYRRYVGMPMAGADRFLACLQEMGKETWLRHVYIPGLNDSDASLTRLQEIGEAHSCVSRIEILPFRRLCLEKYAEMGIPFPLADTREPTVAELAAIRTKYPKMTI